MGFFGLMVGLVGIAYAMIDIPQENEIAIQQSNVYYWADGTQMVQDGENGVNRQNLSLDEIPLDMQDSVVAAENASFWSDSGIDLMGIGRAVVNMARGGEVQSGSTITQQYVKNMYLTQDQTISRKAREILLSIKVGTSVSKEEILQGYLNTSYYNRGASGIQAAAQAYYGIDAKDLNASQCAFLTTVLKGPALYDPYNNVTGELDEENLQRAEERWAWVLERRTEVEIEGRRLSQEDYQHWIDEGFPMPNEPTPPQQKAGQIGYLVDLANHYIMAHTDLTQEDLDRGGFQIHTTFDQTMVDQMVDAVESVQDEYIDPEERDADRHVQFGGAAVVPGDGAIRAIYGGPDWTEHFTNNADDPHAQVGSTFKPFALAAALTTGIRDPEGSADQGEDERIVISPESVYPGNDGTLIENYDGSTWRGEDEDGNEVELHQNNDVDENPGDITLREAMAMSANVPFVQLNMDIGPAQVADAAVAAGLSEDSLVEANDTVPTFVLGVSHPGPIRMASAYATFAASGEENDPYSVTSFDNDTRGIHWEHEDNPTQAFDSEVADTVTDVLRDVVESPEGTAHRAAELGIPVAGKTGTTDDNKSAWFIGYTRELSTAIGMWRAPDDESELTQEEKDDNVEVGDFLSMRGVGGLDQGRISGNSLPLSIWINFMQQATEGLANEDFPQPPDDLGEIYCAHGATGPNCPGQEPPEQETEDEPSDPPDPTQSESPPESPDPTDDPTDDPSDDPSPPCNWPLCNDGGTAGDDSGADQGTSQGNGGPEGDSTGESDAGGTDSGADAGSDQGDSTSDQGDTGTIFGRNG
ncbi:transglycosylase domain-containing protein [Streptomyces hoynatensis]|nr:transglycosylase domain-containing protein [Streptomyces hoynatensis]